MRGTGGGKGELACGTQLEGPHSLAGRAHRAHRSYGIDAWTRAWVAVFIARNIGNAHKPELLTRLDVGTDVNLGWPPPRLSHRDERVPIRAYCHLCWMIVGDVHE